MSCKDSLNRELGTLAVTIAHWRLLIGALYKNLYEALGCYPGVTGDALEPWSGGYCTVPTMKNMSFTHSRRDPWSPVFLRKYYFRIRKLGFVILAGILIREANKLRVRDPNISEALGKKYVI